MTKKIIGEMSIDLIKGEFTPKFYLVNAGERMTEKRFLKGYHTIRDKEKNKIYDFRIENVLFLLNSLNDENKQLKEQLRKEQLRTTPITLTTKISDEDYEKIAALIRSALSNNRTSG